LTFALAPRRRARLLFNRTGATPTSASPWFGRVAESQSWTRSLTSTEIQCFLSERETGHAAIGEPKGGATEADRTSSLQVSRTDARETLRRARKLKYLERDNFGIFTQDTFTDLYRQVTGGIYLVMIAISSIGLLVGGVGAMNIMLVSVTERTREIGVRKALGARRRDILWQFLTEAMTLTAVGGVLGILIGAGVAFPINTFSPFPAVIQTTWVLVAFFVSLAVGLTFGLWPAAKAARLDPIEALRYE